MARDFKDVVKDLEMERSSWTIWIELMQLQSLYKREAEVSKYDDRSKKL